MISEIIKFDKLNIDNRIFTKDTKFSIIGNIENFEINKDGIKVIKDFDIEKIVINKFSYNGYNE